MKKNIMLVCIGLPILICALALLGADSPTPPTAADADRDGMSDAYEQFFYLNYTNPADALLDFDHDRLLNVRESVLGADPFATDTDFDGMDDDIDAVPVSRFFIQWGSPWFTDGDCYKYVHPSYFLGAGKDGGNWISTYVKPEAGRVVRQPGELSTQSGWHVAVTASNEIAGLSVALDRGILTNNLVYALHYFDSVKASLYVDLLDTNGEVVVKDLYGNLMEGTNAEVVALLDVPTAAFTNAAVIYLRSGIGEVTVYEGLLYIDEDNDGLDADQEKQLGTSDYSIDTDGDRVSDYETCFHTVNSNNVVEPNHGRPDDGDEEDQGPKSRIIYVDKARGNDTFTGRACEVAGNKGPKKTVRGGLGIAEKDDTIIIRSGTYNENLDIRGRDVKVFIEGNVKL